MGKEEAFRKKRPLTAAALAFVLAMAFFLPVTSGLVPMTSDPEPSLGSGPESDIVWAENFGRNDSNIFQDVTTAPDGGFVAVGYMNSLLLMSGGGTLVPGMIGTGVNTLIVKYDPNGNIVWADNLGGDNNNFFWGVAAAPDGGFIAVGSMKSTTLTNRDGSLSLGRVGTDINALIVKYDADGKIEWADCLGGGADYNYFLGVTAAPDGGFVAVGIMQSSLLVNRDLSFSLGRVGTESNALIVKYDADGKIEWADCLGGGTDYNRLADVEATPDGGFVAVGFMRSSPLVNSDGSLILGKIGGGSNILAIKYDADGSIVWAENLGGSSSDNALIGVTAAPDGGFVAAGFMASPTLTDRDSSFIFRKVGSSGNTLIVKYDANGKIEWGDNLGGVDGGIFNDITTAPDGGFAAVGLTGRSALFNGDGSFSLEGISPSASTLIVKYDAGGKIEWGDVLGGSIGDTYFNGVTAAPDGALVAVGFMTSSLTNIDGSFNLGKVGSSGYSLLIVKYRGTPPEFAVTVTGDNLVSWSPGTVTYGDVNVEITFVTEPGYRVNGIVSVFMGTAELTEGIDYVFENGVLKILGPVTGDLSVEVRTSGGGGTGERSVTGGGTDLWWVLIAALSALSLLLLLGFLAERRDKDKE